jgi:hypothetical protein
VPVPVVLPWERLLWNSRPWHLSRRVAGEHYRLTDARLVRTSRGTIDEIALADIGEVRCTETRADRFFGTSTLIVASRRRHVPPLTLTSIRRGPQLAALLELLGSDPAAPRDAPAVRAALAWEPSTRSFHASQAFAGFAGVLVAIAGLFVGLHVRTAAAVYAADDPIAPGGDKRDQADIAQFMEQDVMPWARTALGRLKGGADRITCNTCHGPQPDARAWQMPAVAALPQPDLRLRGWETYSAGMDAQMRNAIYGYLAESDNQTKASYMREVVLPGMARILRRPAYDFARSYEYNRARRAVGCYHCHQVK